MVHQTFGTACHTSKYRQWFGVSFQTVQDQFGTQIYKQPI